MLTRLPGDSRLLPRDAAAILTANFKPAVAPDAATGARLHEILSGIGIAGGAVYDALVGLAAIDNKLTLITRDARALATYAAIGTMTEIIAG